ncbi:MAG: N-acetyltransferase [Proteobacteria bacterium]|nr:N-acetyltransferase [Pseudomonadota bacterium]
MAYIDTEKLFDVPAREKLLDNAFGSTRFTKTSERLREGRLPADGLALVARCDDRLVATLRLWHIDAGGVPALMLGPLAVDSAFRSAGLGGQMMRHAITRAAEIGHRGIVLVGDYAYYQRFGFEHVHAARLELPGPVERARFLGLELQGGGLAGAAGMVRATGAISMEEAREAVQRRKAA